MDFVLPATLETMKASSGKILIELLDTEEKSTGGIILHSWSKPALSKGVIMLVGSSKKNQLSQGNVILFDKVKAFEARINERTFWVLNEEDVSAIIGNADGQGKVEIYDQLNIR